MPKTNFYAIGHITCDLLPYSHVSGGTTNSAITAQHLGFQATIITKCPTKHPYIREIEKTGVKVYNLPIKNGYFKDKNTTFKNVYAKNDRRTQYLSETQETISVDDLTSFPKLQQDSVLLVSPVLKEVDTKMFSYLRKFGKLCVAAQGYYRTPLTSGKIKKTIWHTNQILKKNDTISLSDEDLAINGAANANQIIKDLLSQAHMLIYTRNKNGSVIYRASELLNICALKVHKNELFDITGAGDVYVGSFLVAFKVSGDIRLSAIFASLFSGLKIIKKPNRQYGIQSIPTLNDLITFTKSNKRTYIKFLRDNNCKDLGNLLDIFEAQLAQTDP